MDRLNLTGTPVMLKACCVPSPVGWLAIAVSDRGLLALLFCGEQEPTTEQLERRIRSACGKMNIAMCYGPSKRVTEVENWLKDYFSHTVKEPDIPLDLRCGTRFQQAVWQALCRIPYGQTRSYQELAETLGTPRAARAIGQACGRNPVAIIVPCHRVISQSGSLGGYGGGLHIKRFLLNLEQQSLARRQPGCD